MYRSLIPLGAWTLTGLNWKLNFVRSRHKQSWEYKRKTGWESEGKKLETPNVL